MANRKQPITTEKELEAATAELDESLARRERQKVRASLILDLVIFSIFMFFLARSLQSGGLQVLIWALVGILQIARLYVDVRQVQAGRIDAKSNLRLQLFGTGLLLVLFDVIVLQSIATASEPLFYWPSFKGVGIDLPPIWFFGPVVVLINVVAIWLIRKQLRDGRAVPVGKAK